MNKENLGKISERNRLRKEKASWDMRLKINKEKLKKYNQLNKEINEFYKNEYNEK